MAQTLTEAWDVTWYNSHERVRSLQTTVSAAAMDITLTPETRNGTSRTFRLKEVRLTIDTAGTTAENFTITLDSNIGSTHDMRILTKDLTGLTSYNYLFDPQRIYGPGDKLVFAWPNSESRDVGVEIIYCTGS